MALAHTVMSVTPSAGVSEVKLAPEGTWRSVEPNRDSAVICVGYAEVPISEIANLEMGKVQVLLCLVMWWRKIM